MKSTDDKEEMNQRLERQLTALEGLLELPAIDLTTTLTIDSSVDQGVQVTLALPTEVEELIVGED